MEITWEILEALDNKYDLYLDYCENYGEPGYCLESGTKALLLADWNNVPKHVFNALKKQYTLDWYDEYIIDYNNSLAYRTSPDSYSWTPSYVILDGEFLFPTDIEGNAEAYLELFENDSSLIWIFDTDYLTDNGFEQVNSEYFESGWYGREDNPTDILDKLLKDYPNGKFIFCNLENSQFATRFDVYGKDLEV